MSDYFLSQIDLHMLHNTIKIINGDISFLFCLSMLMLPEEEGKLLKKNNVDVYLCDPGLRNVSDHFISQIDYTCYIIQ